MKFGLTLKDNVFDPWRFEYLAYDNIKMNMKARQLDHTWNAEDENHFKQVSNLTILQIKLS